MRRLILLTVLVASGATGVQAQGDTQSSHDRAAATVVDLLQMEQALASTIEVMTNAMVSQNAALEPLRDVFVDFFTEFMRWEDVRPLYIELYRDAFTEAELRELAVFYETPTGRKVVAVTPELMRRGAELGQKHIQPHLPELQRRITARIGGGGA